MISSINREIRNRLSRLTRSWHPSLRSAVRSYLTQRRRSFHHLKESDEPFWFLFPLWFSRNRYDRTLPLRLLKDLLWAQYCVVICIKIHDDLFDRHTDREALVFAGDLFLLEAQNTLIRRFDSASPFWRFYHQALQQSLHAILAVDESQQYSRISRRQIVRLYRNGYAACNIALYGVCLMTHQLHLVTPLISCSGNFAVVGQLLDDLQDIEKDLDRHRLNFAALSLLPSFPKKRDLRTVLHGIEHGLLMDNTASSFTSFLKSQLRRAEQTAKRLANPHLLRFVQSHQNSIRRIEEWTQRRRTDLLFSR